MLSSRVRIVLNDVSVLTSLTRSAVLESVI